MANDPTHGAPPTVERVDAWEDTRLRSFQDGIPHLAWTAQVDGAIDYVNARWLEYTGSTFEELRGWGWIELVHPDDRDRQIERWRRAIAAGERYEEELRIRRHDGVYRWHAMRDWPGYDREGAVSCWFGTATDVDDQRRWADAIRLSEERLRVGNRDLEQFASIASHDLQEPLRMVASYLGLLERQYGDRLDERGHCYVGIAIDAAERMRRLIAELLEYARLGSAGPRREEVDAGEALREAATDLAPRIEECGGTVTFGPLPILRMSRSHLVRLLENLIGNGLKYHRPGVPPVVHVEAERWDRAWVLSIGDNGIGIPEADRGRIFDVFTRLHTRGDFPGTGLGLAICRRIVESYRGRIWVEGADGQGSRFRFLVPD